MKLYAMRRSMHSLNINSKQLERFSYWGIRILYGILKREFVNRVLISFTEFSTLFQCVSLMCLSNVRRSWGGELWEGRSVES